jgi:hypothetical protein
LNVLGPNPQEEETPAVGQGKKGAREGIEADTVRSDSKCVDITWPIRRAIILRGVLGLKDNDELDIDLGLLYALLRVPKYHHGARSFEKIIIALMNARDNGRLHRSALPPQPLLDRETDASEFQKLLTESHTDLEALAANGNEAVIR